MRIALLGSTGMLGSTIAKYLSRSNLELWEYNRAGISIIPGNMTQILDVTSEESVSEFLKKEDFDYVGAIQKGVRLKVATKYVKVAKEHFAKKGMHIDLIKLYGSMELAPLVGLADVIVDLVSTGKTLKANNLVAVEDISDISSRLIINQASLKLKRELLQPILGQFEKALKA